MINELNELIAPQCDHRRNPAKIDNVVTFELATHMSLYILLYIRIDRQHPRNIAKISLSHWKCVGNLILFTNLCSFSEFNSLRLSVAETIY